MQRYRFLNIYSKKKRLVYMLHPKKKRQNTLITPLLTMLPLLYFFTTFTTRIQSGKTYISDFRQKKREQKDLISLFFLSYYTSFGLWSKLSFFPFSLLSSDVKIYSLPPFFYQPLLEFSLFLYFNAQTYVYIVDL